MGTEVMRGSVFILPFDQIGSEDHALVGGKCASLGKMTRAGVAVPPGFAVTTHGYRAMLDETGLRAEIEAQLARLDFDDVVAQERAAQAIQIRFRSHPLPCGVEAAIRAAYAEVKRRARGLHPGDSHGYGAEKQAWIDQTEAAALAWYGTRNA